MLKVNTEKMAFYGKEEQSIARNICDMGSEISQIREKLSKNLEDGETSVILNNQLYKLSETLIQEGKKLDQMGTVLEKIANEYKKTEKNITDSVSDT